LASFASARGNAAGRAFLIWVLRDRWGVDLEPRRVIAVRSESRAKANVVPFAPPLPPTSVITANVFDAELHQFVVVVKAGEFEFRPDAQSSRVGRWVRC